MLSIRYVIEKGIFSFTRQKEMKGLGHAVLCGETLVGNESFGVVLADDLCVPDDGHQGVMKQMVDIYHAYQRSVVAVMEVPWDQVHKYGIIEGKEVTPGLFDVTSMVEKPSQQEAPSCMAIIGRYILTPDIFDILRATKPGKNGEIQLTDALLQQARQGNVLAYRFKGTRFDCGSVDGFVEATNYCYQHLYKKGKL